MQNIILISIKYRWNNKHSFNELTAKNTLQTELQATKNALAEQTAKTNQALADNTRLVSERDSAVTSLKNREKELVTAQSEIIQLKYDNGIIAKENATLKAEKEVLKNQPKPETTATDEQVKQSIFKLFSSWLAKLFK